MKRDAVLQELADCHTFACKIRHRANEELGIKPKGRGHNGASGSSASPRRGAGL